MSRPNWTDFRDVHLSGMLNGAVAIKVVTPIGNEYRMTMIFNEDSKMWEINTDGYMPEVSESKELAPFLERLYRDVSPQDVYME